MSKRVSRVRLAETVLQLAPRLVAMEACCGAHYWGRRFRDLGLEVRLIHAKFVRPYVKSAKNDARDAEAICEATQRPHMRFIPIKTPEQLDIQALHRVRDQLMRWRTMLINQTRGLLAEQGIVLPQGAWRLRKDAAAVFDDPAAELTAMAAELFRGAARAGGANRDARPQDRPALPGERGVPPARGAAGGRPDRRHGPGRQRRRRAPVPLWPGPRRLDRAGAAAAFERRATEAHGHRGWR